MRREYRGKPTRSALDRLHDLLRGVAQVVGGDHVDIGIDFHGRVSPAMAVQLIAAFEPYRDRRLLVFTGADAPQDKVDDLTGNGIEVIRAGPGRLVEGQAMIAELGQRDYRSVYAIAGPEVFSTLVEAGVLDRLYLTITLQLLSGEEIDTMMRGPSLAPPYGMRLVSLYQDLHAPAGAGQWFCIFEPQ